MMGKVKLFKITDAQAKRHGLKPNQVVMVGSQRMEGVYECRTFDGYKSDIDLSDDGAIDLETSDRWQ